VRLSNPVEKRQLEMNLFPDGFESSSVQIPTDLTEAQFTSPCLLSLACTGKLVLKSLPPQDTYFVRNVYFAMSTPLAV
jgi:hypothetical protein